MNEYFSENGPLSKSIDRYKYRREQVDMSLAVSSALDKESILVAEAGTGTGKTFAYLVPALLKECKTIISTGTKTLQDQLFLKDIPKVKKALGLNNRISLLKGRSNYICHHYLHRTKSEGRFRTKVDLQNFIKIEEYARFSNTGDKTLFADVSENAEIWNAVVSSRDNCLGTDCEFYDKCFVIKARADAMNSDIVVVNHHLFFADILLRDVGLSELLPDCQAVIFDEAHMVESVASDHLGVGISNTSIERLLSKLYNERTHRGLLVHYRMSDLEIDVLRTRRAAEDFFSKLKARSEGMGENPLRIPYAKIIPDSLGEPLLRLARSLKHAGEKITNQAERHDFFSLADRLTLQAGTIGTWLQQGVPGSVCCGARNGALV